MKKIKDMNCGDDNVEFTAMISRVVAGKTNGAHKSNYLSITFQDETGIIDAKLWNASETHMKELLEGCVVRGKGDIIKYGQNRQMKIVSIDNVSNDQNQQIQFLQKAPLDATLMMKELYGYIKKISNMKIYTIVKFLYDQYEDKIKVYPAASKNHHEIVSGLAYHTLSMLKLGEAITNVYPQLNKDLIFGGILLHDLGKTVELSGPIVPTYTVEGKLLGHISIVHTMIKDAAKQLNIEGEEVTLLEHIILSHHGKNEFGSPVLPQIREAEIVSFIDNIDARMDMIDKVLETIEPGEFSKRTFALENRAFYKPKMYK
jgi:Predicted HD-superfamily hydrolase